MRRMLRAFGLATLVLGVVTFGAALVSGGGSAQADPPDTPPGQEPCSHGNSGKPCREDPQPLHGKDCEPHGNVGGMNEDHCLGDNVVEPTATTEAPPTSTTQPQAPTATTEAPPTSTTQPQAPTATAEVIVTSAPIATTQALAPAVVETPTPAAAVSAAGLPPAAPLESAVLGVQEQPQVSSLPKTGNGGYVNQSQNALFAGIGLMMAGGLLSLMAIRVRER